MQSGEAITGVMKSRGLVWARRRAGQARGQGACTPGQHNYRLAQGGKTQALEIGLRKLGQTCKTSPQTHQGSLAAMQSNLTLVPAAADRGEETHLEIE